MELAGPSPRAQRTGRSPIERAAVARVRTAVAAMPASLVVQLALWPDELARWARAERAAESLVYNMLAGRKPYVRTRERLARRLGVPTGVLAQLIEGAPAPLDESGRAAPRQPAPGELAWRYRAGGNAIEQAAARAVEREIAAMPAATVVGLAIWPETLSGWARAEGLHASAVWAALAGTPSEVVTRRLARRLGVTWRALIELVDAERLPVRGAPADWSPTARDPAEAIVGRGPEAEMARGGEPRDHAASAGAQDAGTPDAAAVHHRSGARRRGARVPGGGASSAAPRAGHRPAARTRARIAVRSRAVPSGARPRMKRRVGALA
jgi:hypothetical protein